MEQYELEPSVRAVVVAHYERAADLIAASFPLAPVVRTCYPDGIGTEAHYGGPVYEPLPDAIPSVEVGEPPHVHRYVAVSHDSILWLVHRAGTVGLCSWTPSPRDPESVSASSSDADVDRAYDAAGTTYEFFERVLGRKSIDGRGMHLIGSVHYGERYDNAFWDGAQMVYGDGDGVVFRSFTTCADIIAHELTHGLLQSEVRLETSGSRARSASRSPTFSGCS